MFIPEVIPKKDEDIASSSVESTELNISHEDIITDSQVLNKDEEDTFNTEFGMPNIKQLLYEDEQDFKVIMTN